MKTRKHIPGLTLMALVLVALLGFSGLANAQMMGPGMMGGQGMGMMGGNMMGLTPEKQAAMQKIYSEHYTATAQLRQQIFAKQSELNAQLYGGATDDKKVQGLTKEIGDLNARLFEAQVNLKRQLTKEGIPAMGGMGMGMGGMGGMGCGMTNGGMGMGMGMHQ